MAIITSNTLNTLSDFDFVAHSANQGAQAMLQDKCLFYVQVGQAKVRDVFFIVLTLKAIADLVFVRQFAIVAMVAIITAFHF